MSIILGFKLLVVLIFLIAFLRRPSLGWGVGLISVTTAVLLDTIFGTFNADQLRQDLGFFFYVLAGGVMGGMVFWVLAVLWPYLPQNKTQAAEIRQDVVPDPVYDEEVVEETAVAAPTEEPENANVAQTAVYMPRDEKDPEYDRQMLYEQIRDRFSRDDVLDLMFDLEIKENEVVTVNQDMNDLIINIMDTAQDRGQTAALALAIERILTPPAPANLPRLEKINPGSPPTILRHYLLSYYDLEKLQKMSLALGVDWEQLANGSKKTKVRELLLYLYRRNQVDELIALMQEELA